MIILKNQSPPLGEVGKRVKETTGAEGVIRINSQASQGANSFLVSAEMPKTNDPINTRFIPIMCTA